MRHEPVAPARILIVGLNYSPELVGVGKYSGEMARWLAARGHRLRVICAPPYYPQWRVQPPYRGWRFQREQLAGVEVLRCPVWVPARPSPMRRIAHLLSFALSSIVGLVWSARFRPDWVIVIAPTLACAPAAILYSRLCRARSWLHIQDFEVGAAAGLGMAGSAWLWRGIVGLERLLLNRFGTISTISEAMSDQLARRGVEPGRIVALPNWVDCAVTGPDLRSPALRAACGAADGDSLILYAGTLNTKQHLDMIIEAAAALSGRDGIRFVICGEGPDKGRLQRAGAGLPNLFWLAPRSDAEFPVLMASADIHLLPQCEGVAEHVMPSKLGGMLASGRPVVATARPHTDIARRLRSCGLVTPPGDGVAFTAAILRLALDAGLRSALGRQGRHVALKNLDQHEVLSALDRQLRSPP